MLTAAIPDNVLLLYRTSAISLLQQQVGLLLILNLPLNINYYHLGGDKYSVCEF